jgi:hypothetical protein
MNVHIASTLVSGTSGITIAAGSTDVVVLRRLQFQGIFSNGSPDAGVTGIRIVSAGTVVIEDCEIDGFADYGIDINPSSGTVLVKIQDTTLINNYQGIRIKPEGAGVVAKVSIDSSRINNSPGGDGVRANGTGGGTVDLAMTNSYASHNSGNGVTATTSSSSVMVDLAHNVMDANTGFGIESNGAAAAVTSDDSTLSYNTADAFSIAGGTLQSYNNNEVTGPIGSTPTTVSLQ